jgi:hypothetical protein
MGIEFMTADIEVDHFVIISEKVYAPMLIKNSPVLLELPYPPSVLLDLLKKENDIKKIIKGESTYVVLKKPLHLGFENKEFNKNIYSLVKDGGK